MGVILCIESSAAFCTAALGVDGELKAREEGSGPRAHAAELAVIIDTLFKSSGIKPSELDAVAVSKGPGSYTGLRIGVSTAKGICYGSDKPLIGISTMDIMMKGLLASGNVIEKDAVLCPLIDAQRMEVYSGFYKSDLTVLRGIQADILEEDSYREWLDASPVYFFGDGAEKVKPLFETHKNARFPGAFLPDASNMVGLAEERFQKGEFEDLAYFEPYYLKEFIAGLKK